ncbi:MAG TPA: hypothetical protein VJ789_15025 [Burkholderiales bacterium]|nr:hypothetical protein [Burkholderiales bacterium]
MLQQVVIPDARGLALFPFYAMVGRMMMAHMKSHLDAAMRRRSPGTLVFLTFTR